MNWRKLAATVGVTVEDIKKIYKTHRKYLFHYHKLKRRSSNITTTTIV
jgi:hypothetical protein